MSGGLDRRPVQLLSQPVRAQIDEPAVLDRTVLAVLEREPGRLLIVIQCATLTASGGGRRGSSQQVADLADAHHLARRQ
jgi:hypothetical protein